MEFIRTFITIFLLVLIFPGITAASETEKRDKLVLTVVKIYSDGTPEFLVNEVTSAIKKNLRDEDFFIINDLDNPDPNITFDSCIKNRCTDAFQNVVSEGIIILIHINSVNVKIGEKNLSRYVVEDITEARYTMNVATAELLKSSYDIELSGTFTEKSKLITDADTIGKKIRDYYIERKPEIEKTDTKTLKEDESPLYYDITGISFTMSKIKPAGSFNGIADDGYGGNAALNGIPAFFPVITLTSVLNFYSLSTSNSNVNSAYMIWPEIIFGYNFIINQELSFSPIAGAGYSFMYVDGTTGENPDGGGSDFYYNPVLKAGIEGAYSLTKNYSLICGLSYNCIFEQDSVQYFSSFNLGIRMRL